MDKFIAITVVSASPATKRGEEGYNLIFDDGSAIFLDRERFFENYVPLHKGQIELNNILNKELVPKTEV